MIKGKIEFDDFIRTTEKRHLKIVNIIWNEFKNKKLIFESEYEGYYCVSEERFVPNKEVIKKDDHYTNDLGHKLEFIKENNYVIKFSESDLNSYEDLIKSGKIFIGPQINEVKEYMKNNLVTFSLSRPKTRVPWGISVPKNENHVIYVWFEALLNYITSTCSYESNDKQNIDNINSIEDIRKILKNYNLIHVIGKDITKFHCYLLPLLLNAINLLPNSLSIYTHHHFQVKNIKMSKSLNNSIYIDNLLKNYSLNAIRYYFISLGPQYKDISLEENQISKVYEGDIANLLVNLILRISNKKLNDLNEFSNVKADIYPFLKDNYGITDFIKSTEEKIIKMKKDIEEYNFSATSFNIHSILLDLNKIVHASEFWNNKSKVDITPLILTVIETIRILSIFLYPFIPNFVVDLNKLFDFDRPLVMNTIFFKKLKELNLGVDSNSHVNSNINSNENCIKSIKLYNFNYDLINNIFIIKKKI